MGVEEHDGDVRFFTSSGNMVVSRMQNENVQYNPYLWLNRGHFRIIEEIGVEKHNGDVRF